MRGDWFNIAKINIVLEGKFKDKKIINSSYTQGLDIGIWSTEKSNISSYTIIDETNKDQYSFWKGALGITLLGGVGAVAGIGGKKKRIFDCY